MDSSVGVLLLVAGAVLALIGLLALTGSLAWFGRLPGDIRIERGNTAFYFPVVTCIIVSIILTLILSLFRR